MNMTKKRIAVRIGIIAFLIGLAGGAFSTLLFYFFGEVGTLSTKAIHFGSREFISPLPLWAGLAIVWFYAVGIIEARLSSEYLGTDYLNSVWSLTQSAVIVAVAYVLWNQYAVLNAIVFTVAVTSLSGLLTVTHMIWIEVLLYLIAMRGPLVISVYEIRRPPD